MAFKIPSFSKKTDTSPDIPSTPSKPAGGYDKPDNSVEPPKTKPDGTPDVPAAPVKEKKDKWGAVRGVSSAVGAVTAVGGLALTAQQMSGGLGGSGGSNGQGGPNGTGDPNDPMSGIGGGGPNAQGGPNGNRQGFNGPNDEFGLGVSTASYSNLTTNIAQAKFTQQPQHNPADPFGLLPPLPPQATNMGLGMGMGMNNFGGMPMGMVKG